MSVEFNQEYRLSGRQIQSLKETRKSVGICIEPLRFGSDGHFHFKMGLRASNSNRLRLKVDIQFLPRRPKGSKSTIDSFKVDCRLETKEKGFQMCWKRPDLIFKQNQNGQFNLHSYPFWGQHHLFKLRRPFEIKLKIYDIELTEVPIRISNGRCSLTPTVIDNTQQSQRKVERSDNVHRSKAPVIDLTTDGNNRSGVIRRKRKIDELQIANKKMSEEIKRLKSENKKQTERLKAEKAKRDVQEIQLTKQIKMQSEQLSKEQALRRKENMVMTERIKNLEERSKALRDSSNLERAHYAEKLKKEKALQHTAKMQMTEQIKRLKKEYDALRNTAGIERKALAEELLKEKTLRTAKEREMSQQLEMQIGRLSEQQEIRRTEKKQMTHRIQKLEQRIATLRKVAINGPEADRNMIEWTLIPECDQLKRSRKCSEWKQQIQSLPIYQTALKKKDFVIENPFIEVNCEYTDSDRDEVKRFLLKNGLYRINPLNIPNRTAPWMRTDEMVQIKRIETCSWQKRLVGQKGVFAAVDLDKHVILGQYVGDEMAIGEKHTMFNGTREEDEVLTYGHGGVMRIAHPQRQRLEKVELFIDATVTKSSLHLINDGRSAITKEPPRKADRKRINTEFVEMRVNGWVTIFVRTTKKIVKGKQLLTWYGPNYNQVLENREIMKDARCKMQKYIDRHCL